MGRGPEASAPQLPGLDQAWGWCEEGFKQNSVVSRLDAAKSVCGESKNQSLGKHREMLVNWGSGPLRLRAVTPFSSRRSAD